MLFRSDTAEFYYTRLETPQPNEIVFKKCTSAEKPMIKEYRDTLRARQQPGPKTLRPTQLVSEGKVANLNDLSLWRTLQAPKGDKARVVMDEVQQALQPHFEEIAITDVPTANENGVTQYKYDGNHQAVRRRRDELRKELGLDNYGAVRSETFQTRLARRVGAERDANGKIFGQCAEMAAYAADTIKASAKESGYRTYMVQIPGSNHTLVLLSKNVYRAGEKINWEREIGRASCRERVF